MKPRIRLRRGVWCCGVIVDHFCLPPYGHGYTPKEAYADWRAQV